MSELSDWLDNLNLHDTMDATIWAKFWLRTIEANPELPKDEGAMVGWFANAIMAGYDGANRELSAPKEVE